MLVQQVEVEQGEKYEVALRGDEGDSWSCTLEAKESGVVLFPSYMVECFLPILISPRR
jgi:hypothetical protein